MVMNWSALALTRKAICPAPSAAGMPAASRSRR
jgi:hypothetical protein